MIPHRAASLRASEGKSSATQSQKSNLTEEGAEDEKTTRVGRSVATLARGRSQWPGAPASSAFQIRSQEDFKKKRREIVGDTNIPKFLLNVNADNENNNIESQSEDCLSGWNGGNEPPRKKNKMKSSDLHADELLSRTSASFDIIANPSSHDLSPMYDNDVSPQSTYIDDADDLLRKDVEGTKLHGLARSNVNSIGKLPPKEKVNDDMLQNDANMAKTKTNAEVRILKHSLHQGQAYLQKPRKETLREKDERILRRKIRRILLIRHCSTCPIPPPTAITPDRCIAVNDKKENSVSADLDAHISSKECHLGYHCAKGKALCSHIRTCKLQECKYKKCLTTREVLGHYKSCVDVTCKICGPVRSLIKKGKEIAHQRQWKNDDSSSIETIDDQDWLEDHMMESDHDISIGVPMLDLPDE